MGTYNPQRAYGLVVYTDDFSGEARRFYTYNFKGWRVSTSTAHYIESKTREPNIYARLARQLMEGSGVIGAANVEILSNHLSRNSAKMVTFGTLVEALKAGFPEVTEDSYDSTKSFMIDYVKSLATVRPNEVALLSVAQRQRVRDASVADQAVLWHAYFKLAARLRAENTDPANALAALSKPYACEYVDGNGNRRTWQGDLFDRANPDWVKAEVVAPGKKGPRVVNNRQSRQGAFEFLCRIVGVSPRPTVTEGAAKHEQATPPPAAGKSRQHQKLIASLMKAGLTEAKAEAFLANAEAEQVADVAEDLKLARKVADLRDITVEEALKRIQGGSVSAEDQTPAPQAE
jgi:hypothetical protein